MAVPEFDVGDVVRLSVAFKDIDLDPADPTDVTLKVLPMLSTDDEETFTLEADEVVDDTTAVGAFYFDYEVSNHGDHRWRWEGSGALVAAVEGVFTVRKSVFSSS